MVTSCRSGYRRNTKTGRCRKTCKRNETRNRKSGRCRKTSISKKTIKLPSVYPSVQWIKDRFKKIGVNITLHEDSNLIVEELILSYKNIISYITYQHLITNIPLVDVPLVQYPVLKDSQFNKMYKTFITKAYDSNPLLDKNNVKKLDNKQIRIIYHQVERIMNQLIIINASVPEINTRFRLLLPIEEEDFQTMTQYNLFL